MPRALPPVVACVLLLAMPSVAQDPAAPSTHARLPGFAADVAGVTIDYESALPGIGSALLVRSRREEPRIVWTTAPVPAQHRGEATFVWLFGMDASVDQHPFTLRCGERTLRFENPATAPGAPWSVAGDGLTLRFRPTRVDKHGDVFGFATLRVPGELLRPGEPLQLEVRGDASGSTIWYMTFRGAPHEQATLSPLPAVRRGEPPYQPFWLDVVHLGETERAVVAGDLQPARAVELVFGSNRIELLYPPVDAATRRAVTVRRGDHELSAEVVQRPVRPWTVHLVQHTHTDIGYTRPQTEILPEHVRYLDFALDYCAATDAAPDDAQFRWTCEGTWAVREFLRTRPPEQREALRRRVAEGRIELTALPANLSELLDERSCEAALLPLTELRAAGLPVTMAMQDDVNGLAWSFADLLPPLGVKYLTMGQHGHRALVPFDVPTAFWWQAPAGGRLLAFRADHYMTGNRWSLHQAREDRIASAMFRYLDDLESKGYPFDRVAVQYSGTMLDNSPPALLPLAFVRAWNEQHLWPRLRSSTASEFLRWVEHEHGAGLPVLRKAWPDWWSDGVGSAPREAAAARAAQDRLRATEAMFAMALLLGARLPDGTMERLQRVREQLLMYGEHTYGAAESISDPNGYNTRQQWAEKAAYVWDATKEAALLQEAALGLLQQFVARSDRTQLVVVNPRGTRVDGLVRAYVDHAQLEPGRPFRVVDANGAAVAVQRLDSNPDGTWWGLGAAGVPPFGLHCYTLELGDGAPRRDAEPPAAATPSALELVSDSLRLRLDAQSGAIASLVSTATGADYVDAAAPFGFGQLVVEQLGDRAQLERRELTQVERTPLVAERIVAGAVGPLFDSLVVHGRGPGCPEGFSCEMRLFHHTSRLELEYRVRWLRTTAPIGLYAAFPFAGPGRFRYDLGAACVDPEHDLLPGTSSDWHAVQNALSLDGARGVRFGSRDTLLWQLGGLHLGRFQPTAKVEAPHAYAWLLNNYWVTNFLADPDGELRWTFVFARLGALGEAVGTERWGLEEATPVVCRVLPGPGGPPRQPPVPLRLAGAGLLVRSLRPDRTGTAAVVHLQAPIDRATIVTVAAPNGARLQRVNCLDEPLGEPAAELPLTAGERAFARIVR